MKIIPILTQCLLLSFALQANDQPNIIFMLADDLGYGDLSSYNPDAQGQATTNTAIRTPNLDQMAASGVRFTDFHSAAPICSPARRALLTARYPSRLGEWAEAYRSRPEGVIAQEQPTIGMWLQQAGYSNACYGKWNIGESLNISWPGAHGFKDWLIIDHNTGYFQHQNANRDCKGRPMLFKTGGERVTNLEGQYLTNIWTDRAIDFIKTHESTPFFLYLPWSIPHSPLQDPEGDPSMAFNAQPKNKTAEGRAIYVKMVEHLDKQIGRIFTTLKERGLMDNTLIIFTSDNGGMLAANCWPLKKNKQWLEEGGIRVPCIMQWPRQLKGGQVDDRPSIMMDASVSVLAAGQALKYVPSERQLDGINLFASDSPDSSRDFGWRRRDWTANGHNPANFIRQEAYRMGDWKLIRNYQYLGVHSGRQSWSAKFADQLYNLREDIGESNDLASSMPEKYASMKLAFNQWKATVVEQNPSWALPGQDQLGSPSTGLQPLPLEAEDIVLNFDSNRLVANIHKGKPKDLVSDHALKDGVFSIKVKAGAKTPIVYAIKNVNTKKYSKIRYQMRVRSDAKLERIHAVLRHSEWQGKDIKFQPIADGQWHEYVIDCTQSPSWSKWTTKGRIGISLPVPESGEALIELKTVSLLR
tara:strand:+ start:6266 stop:8188 length:1923 start_codon:yes stop_codon:yes gene_type:complete